MPANVTDSGRYELFETTEHHRILVLDHKRWFAWVKGQRGEILVHSDSDHKKDHTIQKGHFYVVDFNNDPKFKDMPHLFLEKNGKYQEIMIPNGLPTDADAQKKVVKTGDTITKDDLERYLKHPKPAGEGESRMSRPGGGSVANVAHYLKGIDLPADKGGLVSYARDKDAPKAVIEQLEHIGKGRFRTMADVMEGLGGSGSAGQKAGSASGLPIRNYDSLTADEITDRLGGLSGAQLKQVAQYERQHKDRKTVLEATERKE